MKIIIMEVIIIKTIMTYNHNNIMIMYLLNNIVNNVITIIRHYDYHNQSMIMTFIMIFIIMIFSAI